MLAALGCAASILVSASAHAVPDPSLVWTTIEAPHVRVSYHSGERAIAERAADVAEDAILRIQRVLGHDVSSRIEMVITDDTDDSNGSAAVVPYHQVRLYATSPDDLSTLGFYDDWMTELVTHELTHSVHIDNTRGIPAWVNAVFGPRWFPNQVQPRWLLEGLAVTEESALTTGGRLRSSLWDMYMRADFLDHRVARLDEMSHYVYRWPQGNIWYLYGSHLVDWVRRTHGDEALRRLVRDYGANPVPYGMGKSARIATGQSVEQWYDAWSAETHVKYNNQLAAITARGRIEGKRITHMGGRMRAPRWIPARHPWRASGSLIVASDGREEQSGLYAVSTDSAQDPTLMLRGSGNFAGTFAPDGALWTTRRDVTKYVYSTGEVYRIPSVARGASNVDGTDLSDQRLTTGARADDMDLSPDGHWVAYAQNRAGTRTLVLAEVHGDTLSRPVWSAPLPLTSQVYTPRFSHDGRTLAFSAWTPGGMRDVFLLDVATRVIRRLETSRAIEGGPSFSPDDRQLYFHGDRSGISNVYRIDLATGETVQLTNVATGAYYPEVSPDRKTLAYVGYGSAGFDLYTLSLQNARTLPVGEDAYAVLPPPRVIPHNDYPSRPYSALSTFVPRSYAVATAPAEFGQAYVLSSHLEDIATLHIADLGVSYQPEVGRPDFSASYSYGRLPMRLGMSLSHVNTLSRNVGYNDRSTALPRSNWGVSSQLSWARNRSFWAESFTLTYGWARGSSDPLPLAAAPDPETRPALPQTQNSGVFRASYNYSNAQAYLGSIGPERGWTVGASISLSHPWLASDDAGASAQLSGTAYVPMPWGRHHTLALRGAGGFGRGNQGGFGVGGYATYPLVDTVRQLLVQGGGVLRGFGDSSWGGREYLITNAEYRFPIARIERGLSTLPVFLSRVSGAAFLDYGNAYDDFRSSPFHTGTGAELWWDVQLGYFLPFTFRTGYAQGLTDKGVGRAYMAATVPY